MILTTDTGQGHNSASYAIRDCLVDKGCHVIILDILNSGKKQVSAHVSSLYSNVVTRAPFIMGLAYGAGEIVSSSKYHSPIYYLNSLYAESLYKKILKHKPQVIVCPHVFSAQAITRLKEKFNLKIPSIGVVTDYTCSPFWEETRLDCYTIPSEHLTDEFVEKGMDEKKLLPLGIPVNKKFKKKLSKKEARNIFGIKGDKVFLLMGGSMGYGKIPSLAKALLEKVPDAEVVACCGHNTKLLLETKKIKGVTSFGYIDNIDILMDAADVLLSKPGGLSTTEAIVKKIPLVITCPIPGPEVKNSNFITSMGMAVSANTAEKAAAKAVRLIKNPEDCKKMLDAQEKYCNADADIKIAELILKMAETNLNDLSRERKQ